MFGKWANAEEETNKSAVKDPGNKLDNIQKYLTESKEKKLQEMKQRNPQFLKPPG